jgi:hypothetical protein
LFTFFSLEGCWILKEGKTTGVRKKAARCECISEDESFPHSRFYILDVCTVMHEGLRGKDFLADIISQSVLRRWISRQTCPEEDFRISIIFLWQVLKPL